MQEDKSIYRSLNKVSENRGIRKILEKENWFRDSQQSQDPAPRPGWKISGGSKGKLTRAQQKHQPVSVLFAPRTEAGTLLTTMRKVQLTLQKACQANYTRMKIVETAKINATREVATTPEVEDMAITTTAEIMMGMMEA